MKPSVRKILADSHVATVAVALLLLFSLINLFHALARPSVQLAEFLITAIAILGVPSGSWPLTTADWIMLTPSFFYLYSFAVTLAAAWLLSRWVYGAGPIRSLSRYRDILSRRTDV